MESKKGNHYDNRKRATFMLRQELAAAPRTMEYLRLKVLMEFGFSQRFVEEFIELHKNALKYKDGVFKWKA
ncbi:MAG: hypothetical protein GY853_02180 [PVC group bacterium]|nr:hypothetical protein [PVC group bacterium]